MQVTLLVTQGLVIVGLVVALWLQLRKNTALVNRTAEIAAKYVAINKVHSNLATVVASKNEQIRQLRHDLVKFADAKHLVQLYDRVFEPRPNHHDVDTVPTTRAGTDGKP